MSRINCTCNMVFVRTPRSTTGEESVGHKKESRLSSAKKNYQLKPKGTGGMR